MEAIQAFLRQPTRSAMRGEALKVAEALESMRHSSGSVRALAGRHVAELYVKLVGEHFARTDHHQWGLGHAIWELPEWAWNYPISWYLEALGWRAAKTGYAGTILQQLQRFGNRGAHAESYALDVWEEIELIHATLAIGQIYCAWLNALGYPAESRL